MNGKIGKGKKPAHVWVFSFYSKK